MLLLVGLEDRDALSDEMKPAVSQVEHMQQPVVRQESQARGARPRHVLCLQLLSMPQISKTAATTAAPASDRMRVCLQGSSTDRLAATRIPTFSNASNLCRPTPAARGSSRRWSLDRRAPLRPRSSNTHPMIARMMARTL